MAEGNWSEIVRKAVINKGISNGFDVSQSNRQLDIHTTQGSLAIRPDVIWKKGNKIKYIFEIDTGAYGNYQKTIFGSLLTGILLAKKYDCVFVEIVRKESSALNDNSKKAKKIESLFKQFYKSPKFHVISVGHDVKKRWAYEDIQKDISKKLKALKIK